MLDVPKHATFTARPVWVRRDVVVKSKKLPDREQVVKRMWKLANAGAGDAVKLACFPPEEWRGTDGMDLDAVTEAFKKSFAVSE